MQKGIFLILKKAYIPFAAIVAVVAFFIFYNNYLVDRSFINLQIALAQISEAKTVKDFEKIRPLLKIPLFIEISKTSLSGRSLAALGMIENIIDTAKSPGQGEDIKLYLKILIEEKEKQRGGFLSALARINQVIYKPEIVTPRDMLLAKARELSSKISSSKNPDIRQSMYYDLGNIYVQLEDLANAESAYLKCFEISPQNPLAIKAIFNLAWACKAYKQFDKAFTYFVKVAEMYHESSSSMDTRFQIADLYFKEGKYIKSANEFGMLGEKNPEFSLADLALYQAGYISFYNLNDTLSAVNYFNRLEEKHPKAQVVQNVMIYIRPVMAKDYRVEGFKLLREGKYDEAVDSFIKAITVAPLDYRSYSGMALGLLWLKQQDAAVEKAGKAVGPFSKDDGALLNAMYVFIKTGRFDDAINIGEQALNRSRNHRPEVYYNIGNAYYQKKDYSSAIIKYEIAIKRNPDFAMFYNNLACALWATKDYSQSARNFREAVSRDPQYLDAHYNLGLSSYSLGRLEEAYKEFKIVVDANPNDKEAKGYIRRIALSLNYQP